MFSRKEEGTNSLITKIEITHNENIFFRFLFSDVRFRRGRRDILYW